MMVGMLSREEKSYKGCSKFHTLWMINPCLNYIWKLTLVWEN